MLIPKYCQNKQRKYGKPEEDGTWHGQRVGAWWAHLPEQRRHWSALTTGHGPAVPGCQCARTREQLPSQPAGSHSASRREPLFSRPRVFHAHPVATNTPSSVRTHILL